MNDLDREEEINKDRMYWIIAIIVVLSILAFIASLCKPVLIKAFQDFYSQAINSILRP
jgi:hypothetical protein